MESSGLSNVSVPRTRAGLGRGGHVKVRVSVLRKTSRPPRGPRSSEATGGSARCSGLVCENDLRGSAQEVAERAERARQRERESEEKKAREGRGRSLSLAAHDLTESCEIITCKRLSALGHFRLSAAGGTRLHAASRGLNGGLRSPLASRRSPPWKSQGFELVRAVPGRES